MLQYLLWTNCNNSCKFCIRGDKLDAYTNTRDMLVSVEKAKTSILNQDWSKYSGGVSVIGGELFFIEDKTLQIALKELFIIICDKVLSVRDSVHLVLISNLLYDISFLREVLDIFKERNLLSQVQLHVSFDTKYRFHSEAAKTLYYENLVKVRQIYPELVITVQCILTQYLIEAINNKEFSITEFEDRYNVKFALLIPLKSNLSIKLPDFLPKRRDFINLLLKISVENPLTFRRFIDSARYAFISKDFIDTQNDEELIPSNSALLYPSVLKCGHCDIYQCYADSDKCMLCDMEALCQRGGTKFE